MTGKHAVLEPEAPPAHAAHQEISIFVVSLARATDRRAAMARHLQDMGLSFEITDAVDGRALSALPDPSGSGYSR